MGNVSYIRSGSPLKEWFRYHFFEKKLNSLPGIFLLCLIAVVIGYVTETIDYRAGFGIAGVFIIVLLVTAFMRFPYFGLYFLIAYSSLPGILGRMFMGSSIQIEFSTLVDVMTVLLFFSIITKPQYSLRDNKNFWTNPITTSFLILLMYYFVEALNPSMHSIVGWISYVRKYLVLCVSFYILFTVLRSWKTIKYFIIFNIVLTTLLAMYACKQQWFGLTDFEWRWATASQRGYIMLLQGGLLRKWSTLSDPATSGILFASVSLQCIVLLLRWGSKKTKMLLGVALIFNLMAYAYSGTRTATLMIVAGIAFYCIATVYEQRTFIFLVTAVIAFVVLMFMPYSPPAIGRIRTTFQGTKDMSAAVREYDRHQIQPYLFKHPIGGGIFTCGMEGPKYNPGHYLMDFQPDSGYMKILAEQGMIGFAILLITYFMIMNYGLHNFYRTKNPELVSHSIALLTLMFSLMVGQYSQFALGPFPQILSYLGALVFLIKLPELDNNHQ
jgi:putative inorganic carbon (HCO3(-)) transporter